MAYLLIVMLWLVVIGGAALMAYWMIKRRPWDVESKDVAGSLPPVVGLNAGGEPIFYPSLEEEPLVTQPDSLARLSELYRRGEVDEATYNRIVGEFQTKRSA